MRKTLTTIFGWTLRSLYVFPLAAAGVLIGCGIERIPPSRVTAFPVWVENIPCGSIANPSMRVIVSRRATSGGNDMPIGQPPEPPLYDETRDQSQIPNPDTTGSTVSLRPCVFLREVEFEPALCEDPSSACSVPIQVIVEIASEDYRRTFNTFYTIMPGQTFLDFVFPFRDGEPFLHAGG